MLENSWRLLRTVDASWVDDWMEAKGSNPSRSPSGALFAFFGGRVPLLKKTTEKRVTQPRLGPPPAAKGGLKPPP